VYGHVVTACALCDQRQLHCKGRTCGRRCLTLSARSVSSCTCHKAVFCSVRDSHTLTRSHAHAACTVAQGWFEQTCFFCSISIAACSCCDTPPPPDPPPNQEDMLPKTLVGEGLLEQKMNAQKNPETEPAQCGLLVARGQFTC